MLHHDLQDRLQPVPVIYPGSIERTSFAEREEAKGYMLISVDLPSHGLTGAVWPCLQELPARTMVRLVLEPRGPDKDETIHELGRLLDALQADAVVQVRLQGPYADMAQCFLRGAALRELAPPTMNIALAADRHRRVARRS